jgi:cobalt-zinc-cadmium efflux system outer membrane protein
MTANRPIFGKWCCRFLVCLAIGFPSVRAETTDLPVSVNLEQLVQILREKSPRLAAERTRIDIAQADVAAARAMPNPSISYGRFDHLGGVGTTVFEGSQQQLTQVDIPVLIAGQRPARREAAERGVTAAEAQVVNSYAGLLKETWQLFVKLLAAQEKQQALERMEGELDRLKDIVVGRAESGAASRYEVVRMEVEAADLRARTEQLRAETLDLSGQIGSTLSLSGWKPRAEGNLQPLGVNVDLSNLKQQAEAVNPAVTAARRQEDAAEAGIEKAKRERWPTPVISLGNTWTNNPYGMASFAGLSVEVPIFDFGQGPIAKARAEKRAATMERQALLSATLADLERASAVLLKNRENLGRFERDVAGRLPLLKEMAEDAYRFSKGNLLELLDATRARTELALRRLELTEAVALAEVDTLTAAGILAETVSAEGNNTKANKP